MMAQTPKKPWPTKKAMQQIYEKNLWGKGTSSFYSGEGSHEPEIVDPYLSVVSSFLESFINPLIVCDLGCGDFNVGKRLVAFAKQYHAIDIVPDLIDYNTSKFKGKNLNFHCLDITTDPLPQGDCALVRQVLQHLSNAEVQSVLEKLAEFKYVILTEHLPLGTFSPNKDIISGQGTRLKKKSGVDLLAPPFSLEVNSEQQLLSIKPTDGKGTIVTTLYTMT